MSAIALYTSRDSFLMVQRPGIYWGIDPLSIIHDLMDIMFVYDILNDYVNCFKFN